MALSEGERDTCKEIARTIVKEVLEIHVDVCPHGKDLLKSKMLLIGIFIGSGVFSSTLSLILAKVVMNL